MKKITFFFLFLISFSLLGEELNLEKYEYKISKDFLWEIPLPGYNFYEKDSRGLGIFFSIARVATVYYSMYYYNRYISYRDLENSAKIADIYYGLGYSYYDPIEKNYKNTKQFNIYAGRSLAYFHYSVSLHLILMGIGLYKGYVDAIDDFEEKLPPIKYNRSHSSFHFYVFKEKNSSNAFISYTIPLDF